MILFGFDLRLNFSMCFYTEFIQDVRHNIEIPLYVAVVLKNSTIPLGILEYAQVSLFCI